MASGSDALLLALMALGLGPADVVLVPPFTFFSTVSAITRVGATPLFVDVDRETLLISIRHLRDLLTSRTIKRDGVWMDSVTGRKPRALLPVHLFGRCCQMDEILAVAQDFNLAVIEDVAQACGARMVLGTQCEIRRNHRQCRLFFVFFPAKPWAASVMEGW